MRLLTMTVLSLAVMAGFAAPVRAEVENYTFDKAHTQIYFSVNHLGFSNSRGRFLEFDGSLQLDRAAPVNSKVDVTINTASIEMNDKAWNDHMKNKDFLNVATFPTMTFKSTAVDVTGENTANVTGDLTLLGVTKPVVLAVTHNKTGANPFSGKTVAGFSATTSIKRSDFGMTYGLPAVGDDITINIEVEAERQDAEATNQ